MLEFAHTTQWSIADLTHALGLGQLEEQHGDKMRAVKALGIWLSFMPLGQIMEIVTVKQSNQFCTGSHVVP